MNMSKLDIINTTSKERKMLEKLSEEMMITEIQLGSVEKLVKIINDIQNGLIELSLFQNIMAIMNFGILSENQVKTGYGNLPTRTCR